MYEDPYNSEMTKAMTELLSILQDKNLKDEWGYKARLAAADQMDNISFHATQANVIRDVTADTAEKLSDQVKKLNDKRRPSWEKDED